jgi:hypothetical protein
MTGPDRLDPQDRIDNYRSVMTKFPTALFTCGEQLLGIWVLGNDYHVQSGFYGGYPPTYLKRIKALFPEKRRVLHLFSGKVDLDILPGDTCDINAEFNPTFVDDAQSLEKVPIENYDLILVDPPYSIEDAERYQTSMVKRNKVLKTLQRCKPGTHIVWLDQVLPVYRKDFFAAEGYIGMVKSTNHRFRVVTIFCRRDVISEDR